MPKSRPAPGYLAEIEASHLLTQAIPGAIVLHLKRDIAIETQGGREARQMFIELTVSEAVLHWRHVGELIRAAGAMASQAAHADAAVNL